MLLKDKLKWWFLENINWCHPVMRDGTPKKAGRKQVSRGKAGSPTWAGKFPAARVGRLGRKGGTSPA